MNLTQTTFPLVIKTMGQSHSLANVTFTHCTEYLAEQLILKSKIRAKGNDYLIKGGEIAASI